LENKTTIVTALNIQCHFSNCRESNFFKVLSFN